jgi:hypothetical protein
MMAIFCLNLRAIIFMVYQNMYKRILQRFTFTILGQKINCIFDAVVCSYYFLLSGIFYYLTLFTISLYNMYIIYLYMSHGVIFSCK